MIRLIVREPNAVYSENRSDPSWKFIIFPWRPIEIIKKMFLLPYIQATGYRRPRASEAGT